MKNTTRAWVLVAVVMVCVNVPLRLTSQTPQAPPKPSPIPDPPYKNLQVLPKDISKPELVQTMRRFAIQLGVRCSHCHVATDDLSSADFALDEKPAKAKARVMIRMLEAINSAHLAQLPSPADDAPRASCWTCHRGESKPQKWKMPERATAR